MHYNNLNLNAQAHRIYLLSIGNLENLVISLGLVGPDPSSELSFQNKSLHY